MENKKIIIFQAGYDPTPTLSEDVVVKRNHIIDVLEKDGYDISLSLPITDVPNLKKQSLNKIGMMLINASMSDAAFFCTGYEKDEKIVWVRQLLEEIDAIQIIDEDDSMKNIKEIKEE